MIEKDIDLLKIEKIACVGDVGYVWKNIHYNKETDEFIVAKYHCNTNDNVKEYCDSIDIITVEEVLCLVYHEAQLMHIVKEYAGFIAPEIIKSVVKQKKRKQSNLKKIEIMTSGLDSDSNAIYYKCKDGSIFKYSFLTCEYYKYEGTWNQKENYLVQLLNEREIEKYSHEEWEKFCDENSQGMETTPEIVTVTMLAEELSWHYDLNKKSFVAFGIFFLIFSVCCCGFGYWISYRPILYIGTIIKFVSLLFFCLYFVCKTKVRNIKLHNFYIVEDTCVAKNNYLKSFDDSGDKIFEKYFRFKEYGEFKLNNPAYIMNNGGITKLYNETQAGDKFYLVYVGKSKKVKLIFNEKHYELSQFEFFEKNNKFIPYK